MSEINKIKDDIKTILAQNGFNQFILVDPNGCIIQQEIKRIKSLSAVKTMAFAKLLKTIKQSASVIGKNKFKIFTISRKNGQNIFIFPVGKFYLGVVKSTDINTTLNLEDQLNSLVNTQLNNLIIHLLKALKQR